ncbi:hypothetical protein FB45DRAFT_1033213 [Roridomyces roridus]|uniref:Uncharacterized protein n=1 Tax=Roridomyces roridus TaxID=1738132 RepID=A0AAD7BFG1_9AGAR|nr:hypothetical protein FB45DRAFT_1033213 [Roridomyces roridus]
MDCQFSFGPNGAFFCKSDTIWAWSDNNLPEPLRLILEDPNHPQANQFPYDVAFPMEAGMFNMCWKTVKGEDYYEELFLGPKYSKLAEFMRTIAQSGEHTTRTVFGPNSSYFTISPSGFSWQHLPADLETSITSRLRKGFPTCVALGVHGSFVALFGDGTITFEVATHYPAVDALIRNSAENTRRRGIAFLSLSPHAGGLYYVAYGDGSASWSLPSDWIQDVTTVSRTLRPVSAAPRLPSAAPLGGFTAAGGVAGAGPSGSPTSGNTSSAMIHAVGKIWHAYQQNQQNSAGYGSGNSSPFAGGFNFDPSNVPTGFDPSSLANFASSLDPGTLASFAGALDPSSVINGITAIFGN